MSKKKSMSDEDFILKSSKILKEWKDKLDKCLLEYISNIKSEIEYIVRSEVDSFYEEYDPEAETGKFAYHRSLSLYDILKIDIDVDNNKFSISIDSKNMGEYVNASRRLSNEAIFHNSIELGWHGGAIPKNGGMTAYNTEIKSGIPYWRTSWKDNYKRWGRPAFVGTPPIVKMEKRIEKICIDEYKKVQSKIDNYDTIYGQKIVKLASRYIR